MIHDSSSQAGRIAQVRPSRSIKSALALMACAALALSATDAGAHHYGFGEGEYAASFATPGYPEGIVVQGHRMYVAGPANFDQTQPEVHAYRVNTGELVDTIPVTHPGADPADALSCITSDADGRLYVLSEALGVVRLTRGDDGWKQEVYAPLPNDGVPGCVHAAQLAPDATDPMHRIGCHLLNDLAFDGSGRLYVTDSFRATIYRVDAGGGAMEPWFTSPYLLGGPPFPIGTNGIRVSPTDDELYFDVTTSPLPQLAGQGAVYKLPLVDAPDQEDLTPVHYYAPGLGPDGMAFGEDGGLWVALAFGNQVSLLGPGGDELARLSGPKGSQVSYDAPANVAFDGHGNILVTNHALFSGIKAHFGVERVFVGDRGMPLMKPELGDEGEHAHD